MRRFSLAALTLISMLFTCPVEADMIFNVNFTAQAMSDLSAAEQQLFIDGMAFWDDVIIDHRDLQSRVWDLEVDTFSQPASGGGVLLGSAGPSGLTFSNVVADAVTSNQRFIISTGGQSDFNVHPDAGALSYDTIKHEIGHALGIGTLWEDNEVYSDEVVGNSNRTLVGGTAGEYVGAAALDAYQAEFVGQGAATFIPVELSGGAGTAHGHWNESDDFGQTLTGIVDHQGRDFRDELMTGFASPNPDFLSNTSIMSMFDIGFNVNVAAVPEPGTLGILAFSFACIGLRRRRRSSQRPTQSVA